MVQNPREEAILSIFYQQPQRRWRFKEVVKEAKLHKDNVNNWLIRLHKQGLIDKIKPKGKFPYYIAVNKNPSFRNRKKLYALNYLSESGLLDFLVALETAKAVIIFGSFSRSDWHKDSDIDVFIFGDTEEIDFHSYEEKLGREIEIFSAKDKKELRRLNPHLLKNIISGYYVRGNLSFLEVR